MIAEYIKMLPRQAKILTRDQAEVLLIYAGSTRHPDRDRLIVLLSVKAGLRAGEIAGLTWDMVLEGDGDLGACIELRDKAAKKRSGRRIPIHPELRDALNTWRALTGPVGPIIPSERGGPMRAGSIVLWFARAYRAIGLHGYSSHSGRRTFITKAARLVHKTGGSLRDVQLLAGHAAITTTQRYIEGDTDAQRKLVSLI
jgi:integrase